MASSVVPDAAPGLIDPAYVPDTFIEGIGQIERLAGNCLRITLFASRDLGDGEIERIVVARLVMAVAVTTMNTRRINAFLAGVPFMTDVAEDVVPS